MIFAKALDAVRKAADPYDESQHGITDRTMARVPRRALQELIRDWERLDREVRMRFDHTKERES